MSRELLVRLESALTRELAAKRALADASSEVVRVLDDLRAARVSISKATHRAARALGLPIDVPARLRLAERLKKRRQREKDSTMRDRPLRL